MHLLLVNMTLDRRSGGGTAEKTVQTARALARAGERVTVLTLGPVDDERRRELNGVEIVSLPLLEKRFWIPFPVPGRIAGAVDEADVVVLANHWTILNALVAREARRRGVPWVVVPSGSLRALGRSLRKKRLYNAFAGRDIIRDAAGHVATTHDEIADFALYGVTPDRVTLIPNAVELPEPVDVASPLDDRRRPIILFLGRLAPVKGPDLLLAAFAAIADRFEHELVLAGPDEGMLTGLKTTVERAGLGERVRFPGFLTGTAKRALLESADAVVVPSRDEAMSLVLLEAALFQRPVLMTDRCGMNHLADAGLAVIASADADSLAAALAAMLTSSDRQAMGHRLFDHVTVHYGWPSIVEKYRELFRRVSAASPPRKSAGPRR